MWIRVVVGIKIYVERYFGEYTDTRALSTPVTYKLSSLYVSKVHTFAAVINKNRVASTVVLVRSYRAVHN